MNTAIYKYPLKEEVQLPKGAKILKIAWQKTAVNQAPFIWALVDLETKEQETRSFQLVSTGLEITDNNLLVKPTYITTMFCYGGTYVIHVFENVKI